MFPDQIDLEQNPNSLSDQMLKKFKCTLNFYFHEQLNPSMTMMLTAMQSRQVTEKFPELSMISITTQSKHYKLNMRYFDLILYSPLNFGPELSYF